MLYGSLIISPIRLGAAVGINVTTAQGVQCHPYVPISSFWYMVCAIRIGNHMLLSAIIPRIA